MQVTHSEVNAAYGSCVIQLRDGWLATGIANPEFHMHEATRQ